MDIYRYYVHLCMNYCTVISLDTEILKQVKFLKAHVFFLENVHFGLNNYEDFYNLVYFFLPVLIHFIWTLNIIWSLLCKKLNPTNWKGREMFC